MVPKVRIKSKQCFLVKDGFRPEAGERLPGFHCAISRSSAPPKWFRVSMPELAKPHALSGRAGPFSPILRCFDGRNGVPLFNAGDETLTTQHNLRNRSAAIAAYCARCLCL